MLEKHFDPLLPFENFLGEYPSLYDGFFYHPDYQFKEIFPEVNPEKGFRKVVKDEDLHEGTVTTEYFSDYLLDEIKPVTSRVISLITSLLVQATNEEHRTIIINEISIRYRQIYSEYAQSGLLQKYPVLGPELERVKQEIDDRKIPSSPKKTRSGVKKKKVVSLFPYDYVYSNKGVDLLKAGLINKGLIEAISLPNFRNALIGEGSEKIKWKQGVNELHYLIKILKKKNIIQISGYWKVTSLIFISDEHELTRERIKGSSAITKEKKDAIDRILATVPPLS
jgi:hypothetical protein